jgi:hypothetical protein
MHLRLLVTVNRVYECYFVCHVQCIPADCHPALFYCRTTAHSQQGCVHLPCESGAVILTVTTVTFESHALLLILTRASCRVACHYGDTEQQLSSTLTISSGAVFNRVMLFMLKEADGIFRRMLGLPQDASSAAAGAGDAAAAGATGAAGGGKPGVLLAEHVPKAPRWRKVNGFAAGVLLVWCRAGICVHVCACVCACVLLAEHVPKAPRWRKVGGFAAVCCWCGAGPAYVCMVDVCTLAAGWVHV